MSTTTAAPDIHAMLDAYSVLGVEHAANPAEIRHAYKRLAREHHPDGHRGGSEGQREATRRMAAINAAYRLARDAPLRHHRVSTRSQPDVPWMEAELEAAIRRARADRIVARASDIVSMLFVAGVVPWMAGTLIHTSGLPSEYSVVLMLCVSLLITVVVSLDYRLYVVWELLWVLRRLTSLERG